MIFFWLLLRLETSMLVRVLLNNRRGVRKEYCGAIILMTFVYIYLHGEKMVG